MNPSRWLRSFTTKKLFRRGSRNIRPRGPVAKQGPKLEELEARTLLTGGVFKYTWVPYIAPGHDKPQQFPGPGGLGFTPQQIRSAYGIDQITWQSGKVVGDGTGQTIAIVDAYDDPTIKTDLVLFDTAFGLPDPPSFQVVNQTGGSSLPGTDGSGGWEVEESLDVEWSHATAPGANIILVEGNDASFGSLNTAVTTAASLPGVVVVSMSYGSGESGNELSEDAIYATPGGHNPVTFLASTGDSGAPGGYPAYSPNVVAVGGTTLSVNSDGSYGGESGWSGSGGGISQYESQPTFQNGVATPFSSTQRTIPDVSYDADPNSGVPVCDSFTFGASTPWDEIGGTSYACPSWAGLVAIADQGRALASLPSLDGPSQTLPKLYSLPATDFNDITTGNNGFDAGPGYDLVTGIGTPIANLLVPDLAGIGSGGGGGTQTDTISGQVFEDTTGAGAFMAGDPGLQGITVFLDLNHDGTLDSGDPTATTDASGKFSIPGLADGTYDVREVLPAGWIQTTPNPPTVTASGGKTISGLLFGEFQLDNFTGVVFQDNRRDGQKDPGDPGLQGWTVNLINAANNAVVATQITDGSGNYAFTGVGPGTYEVREVLKAGWVMTTFNPPNDTTNSGANFTVPPIGVFQLGTISGQVFQDFNGDGSVDGSDSGLAGWTVHLLNAKTNSLIASQVTGANGAFSFSGLQPGIYQVREVLQPGFVLTTTNPTNITTTSGTNVSGLLFGDFQQVSISGQAFVDNNGDGIKDGSEAGIKGWTIQLINASTNALISTQVTDANGNFAFTALGAGTYEIREVVQVGYALTTTVPANITASSGSNVVGVSFGDFQFGSISGQDFVDASGNGVQTGTDVGLAGTTIQLINANTNTVVATQVTDAGGNFTFSGVAGGTFSVLETLPAGTIQTTTNPLNITAVSGGSITGVNFGNFQLVSISGQSFQDNSGTGTFNSSDVAFAGSVIQLENAATNAVLATQTTGANGNYQFANLTPGSYQVVELPQAGILQTTISPPSFTASSGNNQTGVNFGNFQLLNVSGQTFQDNIGNGVKSGLNAGLTGATVQLVNTKSNIVVAVKTSDANGNFTFTAVGPGSFKVTEKSQAGLIQTTTVPTFTTASGTNVSGLSIGSFQLAMVSGQTFNDPYGVGNETSGTTSPTPGFTIQLYRDVNGSGQLSPNDPAVASTVVNASGQYTFKNLGPGQYLVQQVKQPSIIETFPNGPATYAFTTTSGAALGGKDFGNIVDPNRGFVYEVYINLLNRHVDVMGMDFWAGLLDQAAPRSVVVQGIENSSEYHADEINNIYLTLLGRPADPIGMAAGLSLLADQANAPAAVDPIQQLKANILASDEFFQHSGGTNAAFLSALYNDVLARNVDAAGGAGFESQLAQGVSRILIVKGVLFSAEADQVLVNGYYQQFLGRQADPFGSSSFVNSLRQGAMIDSVITALLTSGEYFQSL